MVELDGGGHYEAEQQRLDEQRTKSLKAMGLTVVRFSNRDVDRNFDGVCQAIDLAVQRSLPQSR